jgi:hypothetical protein
LLSKHNHKVKPALRDSKQPRFDDVITNQSSFSIEVFEEFLDLIDRFEPLGDAPFSVPHQTQIYQYKSKSENPIPNFNFLLFVKFLNKPKPSFRDLG